MSASKRRRISTTPQKTSPEPDDDSTDTKLAILASLHPNSSLSDLLEALLAAEGNVTDASEAISRSGAGRARLQSSLANFLTSTSSVGAPPKPPKKGSTLHLYTPATVAQHSPCTLHHSFLPPSLSASLLTELLTEATTFPAPAPFTLFSRPVTSPHTACLFLRSLAPSSPPEMHTYQGRAMLARAFTPSMAAATDAVEAAVSDMLITNKPAWGIPDGGVWRCTAALVNRYAGPQQSVGWHADEPTYIGPMAAIASLSLGVEREFRIRRSVGKDGDADVGKNGGEGQYSIHLPHNSLLLMHPGMQEAWKHCVHPVRAVDTHPIAGETRINITYRMYRESYAPELTPRCGCNQDDEEGGGRLPMMLRAVFGTPGEVKDETGEATAQRRYFWMCGGTYRGDGVGCGAFRWARFDQHGDPIWEEGDPGWKKDVGTDTKETCTQGNEGGGRVATSVGPKAEEDSIAEFKAGF